MRCWSRPTRPRSSRLDRVRADTTVVEANITYPTDSGLLVRAVALIVTLVPGSTRGRGVADRVRDRRQAAGRRARSIWAHLRLRNDEAKAEVLAITGELADSPTPAVAEAARCWSTPPAPAPARREPAGAAASPVAELEDARGAGRRVIAQTRTRLGGDDAGVGDPAGVAARTRRPPDPQGTPRQAGRVRLQGPGRRQHRRARHRPLRAHRQPRRHRTARPAIERITTLLGRAPTAVTADRGYWDSTIESDLADLGVDHRGDPPHRQTLRGTPPSNTPRLPAAVKWRTG